MQMHALTALTAIEIAAGDAAAKRVARFVAASRKWHALCAALSAAEKGTAAYDQALAAWQNGRMPSKAAKHHAYSDAYTIERLLGLPHASTVDGLAATAEAWKARGK